MPVAAAMLAAAMVATLLAAAAAMFLAAVAAMCLATVATVAAMCLATLLALSRDPVRHQEAARIDLRIGSTEYLDIPMET